MKLIDADALIERLKPYKDKYGAKEFPYYMVHEAFIYEIGKEPTVDAAPVRHGRWIGIDDEPCDVWECDVCGYIYETDSRLHNYCPNCGARMDEE